MFASRKDLAVVCPILQTYDIDNQHSAKSALPWAHLIGRKYQLGRQIYSTILGQKLHF